MPDASHEDIDCDTSLLCTLKQLVIMPPTMWDGREYCGIGDNHDHNDRRWGDKGGVHRERHCATFHKLFDHMRLPMKHAGRIGHVCSEIVVRHQNGVTVDL